MVLEDGFVRLSCHDDDGEPVASIVLDIEALYAAYQRKKQAKLGPGEEKVKKKRLPGPPQLKPDGQGNYKLDF